MTARPSATSIFRSLEATREPVLERLEFATSAFSAIRRNLRYIILSLADSGNADALELCRDLRSMLSRWLTTPVPFDAATFEPLYAFGDLAEWRSKWGVAVSSCYEEALAATERSVLEPSPLRLELGQALIEALRADLRVMVACHRRAVSSFISLLANESGGASGGAVRFIHTASDYRDAVPFDILIKVGPLRTKGWGTAPGAILSAPRYRCLKQFVWSGCMDEADFGIDPILAASINLIGQDATSLGGIRWRTARREATVDKWDGRGSPDEDDLSLVAGLGREGASHDATLLHLGPDEGILYPPHALVVSYDPSAHKGHRVASRTPGETLVEGLYLVLPRLEEVDLGGAHAGEGHLSRLWKEELRRRYHSDARDLVIKLRDAGIRLQSIDQCIKHWCKPTTTVITAPQKVSHFKALIEVLQVVFPEPPRGTRAQSLKGWERAWLEVRRSRGEAIQHGLQAQDIISQSLIDLLNRENTGLLATHAPEDFFEVRLPKDMELNGVLRFFRVRGIEHGFKVPDNQLKLIVDLDTVEQWRA